MAEIINLRENQNTLPKDLKTFNELVEKYGVKYSYLYKYGCRLQEIPVYDTGLLRISEQDYLDFVDRKTKERRSKWRA